ncbi:MAG: insulinase family protein [Acidobacteria bacterium]|nr:insulinase family protein [Acidobacteriota bacterium]
MSPMGYHPGPRADIQKTELKNGLVLMSEAMTQLRSVSIGVWLRAGSRFESAERNGVAHFIEHLLFKGTEGRAAGDIARAIDAVGGQLDAFTDKEYICVYARVMDRHLAVAFGILADILLRPAFPPAEVRRERNVIFEEINTIEDSPHELIHDYYLANLWPGHPLGRPVSGTKETVAAIRRRDLSDFFRRHYSGRNMVIAVAGNLRHSQVQRLAERHFGELAAGEPAEPGPPPRLQAGRVVRTKANLEQVHICLGAGCPSLLSRDRFSVHLLSTILGGGMSSRLFQNIREKRGLVYSIESVISLFSDAGTMAVSAAAVPAAAARVVDLVLKELRTLRRVLVSRCELSRAKEFVQGSFLLGLENSSSRMMHLAQQQLYFDRLFSVRETLDRIERVRSADVRRVCNDILDSSGLALTALGNDRGGALQSVALKV